MASKKTGKGKRNKKSKEDLLSKQIKQELKWIKEGSHKKNKSRIKSYYNLIEQKQDMSGITSGQIIIPNGPRLGDSVISFNSITKKMMIKYYSKISVVRFLMVQ